MLYERLLPWRDRQLLGVVFLAYGSAGRQLGILAGTMRRWEDAERHFEDALAMNTRMGARPWVARTQFDYAVMLRRRAAAGDSARARELLQQALATAQEIGMVKVAVDCEALLSQDPLHMLAITPFVGRGDEIAVLKNKLDAARAGRGSLTVLVGEPGIGKTRTLEEFCAHAAEAGSAVLWGRCYDGEWAAPFSPFAEMLLRVAAAGTDEDLRVSLGADAGVLARIAPALRDRLPDITEPPRIPIEAERYRLLDSVAACLGRIAQQRPLVAVLDDLHWADGGTIAMLSHVARNAGAHPIVLIGTYRDVEVDATHPLTAALAGLRRETNFERIAIDGLPATAVGQLIDRISQQHAPPALTEAIARETDGNPFFIKEVLLHLVEEGKIVRSDGTWTSTLSIAEMGIPEGVREVNGRRLSRVSETCGRMLTIASALTAGFSWEVISAISDAGDAALLDAVDEALAAQLIVERERGRYDFTHALIRHTLYEELSTPRRVLLHRQIGEALERLYASDIEPHLAELAHHFCRSAPGGDVAKSIDYATRAGARAVQALAFEEGAAQYELAIQALELMEKPDRRWRYDLLSALGRAYDRASVPEKATATTEQALGLAEGFGDPHLQAEAAVAYFEAVRRGPVANTGVAIPAVERALAVLGSEESALTARLLARLSGYTIPRFETKTPEERLAFAQRAKTIAERSGDRTALLDVLTFLSYALKGPANTAKRLALTDELLPIAEELGDRAAKVQAWYWRLVDLAKLGEMDQVRREVSIYCDLAEDTREPMWSAERPFWSATLADMEGRYAEAEQHAFQYIRFATPHPSWQGALTTQLYDIRRAQGRLSELESALHQFEGTFDQLEDVAVAYLYLEEGRLDDARSRFERVAAHDFADVGADQSTLSILAWSAELARRLCDPRRAALLYEDLLPYADRQIVGVYGATCLGSAAYALGELAAAMGRWDDAERHFDHALAFNERIGAWPWLARTRHEYASMLHERDQSGDHQRAQALVEQALATFEELGMKKDLERALALKLAL